MIFIRWYGMWKVRKLSYEIAFFVVLYGDFCEKKPKNLFYLGRREQLAVYESGQCLFVPRARFETKGEVAWP